MLYTNSAIHKRINRAKKIKRAFTILIYIILFPILIYNLAIIFQTIAFPQKTPTFFGIKTYTIASGSMQPYLDVGDIVIVKNAQKDELKEGDIISYREGERVITHRIIEIDNSSDDVKYKTKGDNNNVEDNNLVKFNLVEGKVVQRVSKLGYLSIFLKNKIIIIVIVLLCYICIFRSEKRGKKRALRRLKRDEYERKNNK